MDFNSFTSYRKINYDLLLLESSALTCSQEENKKIIFRVLMSGEEFFKDTEEKSSNTRSVSTSFCLAYKMSLHRNLSNA